MPSRLSAASRLLAASQPLSRQLKSSECQHMSKLTGSSFGAHAHIGHHGTLQMAMDEQ